MKTEQKEKIRYGDYQLLAEMLDTSSDAAKMRFRRNDPEAVDAMKIIQENRKKLVKDYKNN